MFYVFCVSDLSVGLVTVLTDLVWKITVKWYVGDAMCKIVKFAQVRLMLFAIILKNNKRVAIYISKIHMHQQQNSLCWFPYIFRFHIARKQVEFPVVLFNLFFW